ncbi:LysE family translocator [Saccharothrix syringae]|uniref:LysE family translocator n=1 Tax=Saccharothrix syringae TaxID=103733 RepID=UPI00052585D6|nr:LysE family translocator [Saccharothrix syringae]
MVALTPGANNLLGMHHAVHHGPLKAATALLGRLAAFAIMVVAVVAGLGPVLAASHLALTIIKWAGVAYLAYLALRVLTARTTEATTKTPAHSANPRRKEFLVAISNPKAILIFTAFVPQFVDPARAPVPLQLAVLGAVYLAAELLAGTAYVAVGAGIRKAGLTRRARARLDKATGAVLLGMAGALAVSKP